MKPSAWRYPYNDDYNVCKENPKRTDGLDEPLYAIDFTKYKLVPLEPTEEMMTEGKDCQEFDPEMELPENEVFYIYKAMIEAAPDIGDI